MTEKTRKVMHSSAKDDWGTPQWLFDELHSKYKFTLDLCATEKNALLPRYCQDVQSGMLIDTEFADVIPIDWSKEVFFCNPPYGRQLPKVLAAIPDHAHGVLLLPSRTGSKWWHDLMRRSYWVFYIQGRLRFEGADYSAPFDSALIGMGSIKPPDLMLDGYYHYGCRHISGANMSYPSKISINSGGIKTKGVKK